MVFVDGALFLFLVFALAVKAMAILFDEVLQQWREVKKKIRSLQRVKKNVNKLRDAMGRVQSS